MRRTTLAAIAALTIMATSAATANASFEVVDTATGNDCGAIYWMDDDGYSGGCPLELDGGTVEFKSRTIFGFAPFYTCDIDVSGLIANQGWFVVLPGTQVYEGPNSTSASCDDVTVEGLEWIGNISEVAGGYVADTPFSVKLPQWNLSMGTGDVRLLLDEGSPGAWDWATDGADHLGKATPTSGPTTGGYATIAGLTSTGIDIVDP